ncbi:MAG: hypothetical protein SFZ24_03010 [Planctomycetota bacterium]|nr:hypothetical protein [Planctomycetota bacterium]
MTKMPAALWLALLVGSLGARAHADGAGTIEMTLEVDVTDLPRNLARSSLTLEVPGGKAGPLDLFFVVWTPGNHTPSGPIENLVELRISDCRGRPLRWDRDPTQVERITIDVPEGCATISASLAYIAGQPNNNSRSTDTYGRPNMGVLNWNTVLLYPGGVSNQEVRVSPSLALPAEWTYATSLQARTDAPERFGALRELTPGAATNFVSFETVPLAELVDSPVIMGRHVRHHRLNVSSDPSFPPHTFHLAAADPSLTVLPGWMTAKIEEMCRQTCLLFAPAGGPPRFPRERFEFLITLDDGISAGVEHAESTFIADPARTYADLAQSEFKGGGRHITVVPHEYFHVWCGKLRAPDGLVRADFHTPVRTELLWVYEGLTSYYDSILAARSGMMTFEEYKQEVLDAAVTLEQRTGRLWRSVEDTARAARFLRQRGLYWYDKRRGQEYYGEGAKFWMEADAIIRRASGGARSLDDFCRVFFDVPARPVGDQATFTRGDVVEALRGLEPGTDWDGLIRDRIESPADSLDMGPLLERVGYRIEYHAEPTAAQRALDEGESGGEVRLRTSLGMRVSKDAEVIDIVPGGPADTARLAYGMKVLAVNGWAYSAARLREAVRSSTETKSVELLVSFGDRVEPRVIAYDGGPRIPRLVRTEGAPDLLAEVVRPR